jgi:hypothetical protein
MINATIWAFNHLVEHHVFASCGKVVYVENPKQENGVLNISGTFWMSPGSGYIYKQCSKWIFRMDILY